MQRLLADYAATHGAQGIASLLQRHQEPPQPPQPVMPTLQNFGMSDLHRAQTALHATPIADPKLLQIRQENLALENLIHNLIASGVVEAPRPAAPRDPLLDQIQAIQSVGQLQQGLAGSPLAAYQGVLGGHAGPSILSGKVISQQQQQLQLPAPGGLYYHNQGGVLPQGLLAPQAQAQPLYQPSPVGSPQRKPIFQDSLQQLVSAAAAAQTPIPVAAKFAKTPLRRLKPSSTAPETVTKIQPPAPTPTPTPADGPAREEKKPSQAAANVSLPERKDSNKSVQEEDQEEKKEKIQEAPKRVPTEDKKKKRANPHVKIQGKKQRQIEHCKMMRAKRKVPNGRPRVNPVKPIAPRPPKPQEDQPLVDPAEALLGLESSRTRRVRKTVQKFGSIPDDQMYFCGRGGLAYKDKGESSGGAQAPQGRKAPQASPKPNPKPNPKPKPEPKRASNAVGDGGTKRKREALVKAAALKPRRQGLSEADKKRRKENNLISSFLKAAGLDPRGEYLAKESDNGIVARSASRKTVQYQLNVADLSYLSLLLSEATFHSPKRIVEMCQDLKRWMGPSAGAGEAIPAEQPLSKILLKDPRFEALVDRGNMMLYLPRRVSQAGVGSGENPSSQEDARVSLLLADRASCRKDRLLHKQSVVLREWWSTKAAEESTKAVEESTKVEESFEGGMSADIGRQIAMEQIKPPGSA